MSTPSGSSDDSDVEERNKTAARKVERENARARAVARYIDKQREYVELLLDREEELEEKKKGGHTLLLVDASQKNGLILLLLLCCTFAFACLLSVVLWERESSHQSKDTGSGANVSLSVRDKMDHIGDPPSLTIWTPDYDGGLTAVAKAASVELNAVRSHKFCFALFEFCALLLVL